MTRMFKNVVRGFSPVHDPEGSHYNKEGVCLAMTKGVCLAMTKIGVDSGDELGDLEMFALCLY